MTHTPKKNLRELSVISQTERIISNGDSLATRHGERDLHSFPKSESAEFSLLRVATIFIKANPNFYPKLRQREDGVRARALSLNHRDRKRKIMGDSVLSAAENKNTRIDPEPVRNTKTRPEPINREK